LADGLAAGLVRLSEHDRLLATAFMLSPGGRQLRPASWSRTRLWLISRPRA